MIRFSAKEVTVEIDAPEDVVSLLKTCLEKLTSESNVIADKKQAMTNAERQRKYRDKKTLQNSEESNENVTKNVTCNENVTKNVTENVTENKEEREEKEGVLPFFPSFLSSSPSNSPNNNPITPLSPLPEEKEEREEEFMAGAGKRGELLEFGEFVRLSAKEYKKLCDDFGYQNANGMIRRMNSYIGEDGTGKLAKKYETRNHNLTLRNWENRHQQEARAKTRDAPVPPKEETWREVAERMQREREARKEVIDL